MILKPPFVILGPLLVFPWLWLVPCLVLLLSCFHSPCLVAFWVLSFLYWEAEKLLQRLSMHSFSAPLCTGVLGSVGQ